MKRIERLVNETVKHLEKCKHCWAARFCNICFMDILKVGNKYCEESRKMWRLNWDIILIRFAQIEIWLIIYLIYHWFRYEENEHEGCIN